MKRLILRFLIKFLPLLLKVPDTDVLLLLVDLVSCLLTGADWGGKFVRISKNLWIDAYLKLCLDPAINCFRELGKGSIYYELCNGELPTLHVVKALEHYVWHVYSSTGPTTIPSLRWELFRSKNLEGETLPPTRAALRPHIISTNYITMRDKSYQTICPSTNRREWIESEEWTVCMCQPCVLLSLLELIKCGCEAGCRGWCSCSNNRLLFTPLCKCYGGNCENTIREVIADNDIDDE